MITLAAGMQLQAQNRITVEAYSNDISYYLDLKAIASVFGDSRNLEDFERRINDYNSGLSNLDLNSDGYIDYLRVIETSEQNIHLTVIQAVLDRDVFQDVASIVVERDRYRRTYVQVIGDPYLYGHNYIIEPVFYRTPSIINWFWTSRYRRWVSPYYWGYYPRYYHSRRPLEVNIYMTNIHQHINVRHQYRYSDNRRNDYSAKLHSSIGRNDYSVRYPDREFSKRNSNVRNKAEFSRTRENSRSYENSNAGQTNSSIRTNEANRRTTTNQPANNSRNYQSRERTGNSTQTSVTNQERSNSNTRRSSNSYQQINSRSNNSERNASRRNSYEKPTSRPTVKSDNRSNERSIRNTETVKESEPVKPAATRNSNVRTNESKRRESSVKTNSNRNSSNNSSRTQRSTESNSAKRTNESGRR